MKVLPCLLILLAAIPCSRADNVDELLNASLTKERIPGASIVVLKAGKVIKAGDYGQTDVKEAFDRFLATGKPAFVGRVGPPPSEVFAKIHASGGIASLAHPGLLGMDDSIPEWVDDGLTAIEVCHSDHDAAAEARYRELARTLGLAVSGGSDFHGDESHGDDRAGD